MLCFSPSGYFIRIRQFLSQSPNVTFTVYMYRCSPLLRGTIDDINLSVNTRVPRILYWEFSPIKDIIAELAMNVILYYYHLGLSTNSVFSTIVCLFTLPLDIVLCLSLFNLAAVHLSECLYLDRIVND
jgi:hypothetical protein